MKICKDCGGKPQPLSEFYDSPSMKSGKINSCKDCIKKRSRKHRTDNLETVKAYDRERGRKPERLARNRFYRKTEHGKKVMRKAHAKYKVNNPEKVKVHKFVGNAIRDGHLTPKPCEVCGCDDRKIEAHHANYKKPLEVIWLCEEHHKILHREFKKYRYVTVDILKECLEN